MSSNLLEIKKERVARSFLRGLPTYDHQAVVQRRVNDRLMLLMEYSGQKTTGRILEVGCCTGLLTELIYKKFKPEKFFINDLVPEFYKPVLGRLDNGAAQTIFPVFGDIESVEIPSGLDLVISSSAFQWFSDLESVIDKISRSLSVNGRLIFSMFGEGTFHELKELTGTGLHYHPLKNVITMLGERFRIIHSSVERDNVYFSKPHDVLRHIQDTGVGGVGGFKWTPRKLEKFKQGYEDRFLSDDGLQLSYVSYYFIAEKMCNDGKG